jgi:heme-degrading monooxygenase HmoA
MFCALTVRHLKPGSFDRFKEAFTPGEGDVPAGWVRFYLLRGLGDDNEVISFGYFDGTPEQMRSDTAAYESYGKRMEAIAPHVELVGADGLYDVELEFTPSGLDPANGKLCAFTIRKLTTGSFDSFKSAFMPSAEDVPEGWVRFHMLRSKDDPDEVVTFGFFDGTLDDLSASQGRGDEYRNRLEAVAPYVESVKTNGVYDIAVAFTTQAAAR